jgi:hypothetical protein
VISLECEPWLWNAIVQHLKTKTGLDCDCLGSLNIRRTIAHRMKQTQTRTVANYWFQLQQHGTEWQAFLDEVVVVFSRSGAVSTVGAMGADTMVADAGLNRSKAPNFKLALFDG